MGGWRARSSVRSQRNCYRSRPLEAIHDLNKPNLNFKRCPASPQSGLGNLGSLLVWPCRSPFRLCGQSWQYDTPNHSPRCSLSRPEISLHLISACVIPAKDFRCITPQPCLQLRFHVINAHTCAYFFIVIVCLHKHTQQPRTPFSAYLSMHLHTM
jgi:hypothetical protein